jgi:hypothetical protein
MEGRMEERRSLDKVKKDFLTWRDSVKDIMTETISNPGSIP